MACASAIIIAPSVKTRSFWFFILSPPKTKKVRNRSHTPKNANSDCRQTNLIELEHLYHNHYPELRFYQILKMIMAKKGYKSPIKKKIPLILLLNLFGIYIIAQFLRFVNILSRVL